MSQAKKIFYFVIFLLVSSFFVLILSDNTSAQPSSCVRPAPFPKVINQSGTICPGNYRFGITLSDNVAIDCNNSATFVGANWNGTNGLTLSNKRNVTVMNCAFERFRQNGVFVGNESKSTYKIFLGNIRSERNGANGIFVGHNVVDFHLENSKIIENRLNGVIFKSNYVGAFNESYARLFPSDLLIAGNLVFRNKQNGIYFDAHDYLALNKFSTITFLFRNGSIALFQNNISENGFNGIKNEGLSEIFNSQIMNNDISYNGLAVNSSGILILSNKSKDVITYPNTNGFRNHGVNGFGYIYSNDLEGNSLDGISLYVPKENPSNQISVFNWTINIEGLHYNYIRKNFRNGISFLSENLTNNVSVNLVRVSQNDISQNNAEGVRLKGLNRGYGDSLFTYFLCNDVLLNGNGNKNGIEIINFSRAVGYLGDRNIIENNSVGLIVEKGKVAGEFLIGWNHLGFNLEGLKLFGNGTSLGLHRIRFNDFDRNVLQAYDSVPSEFTHNWWSDYSPSCADSQPDGWCDIPRPIPIANQDIEPRAGNIKYGWKNRMYFDKSAYGGVTPKGICQLPEIPQLPGSGEPGTGKGTGKTSGKETEGSDSGTVGGTTTIGEPPGFP